MGSDKKDKKDKKKDKKEKKEKDQDEEPVQEEATIKGDYQTRLFVSPIATPLAEDKLSKKLLKLIKKGMKDKLVRRGVKETVKAIRKGTKGVCWESSGSPLLIILEFGGLFNHKFCKFLCLVRYERNLRKVNTYLVFKIKKVMYFTTRAGWSNGYDTCLSPKRPRFNTLSR